MTKKTTTWYVVKGFFFDRDGGDCFDYHFFLDHVRAGKSARERILVGASEWSFESKNLNALHFPVPLWKVVKIKISVVPKR